MLRDLINTDEGSKRLGEVALVPDDSQFQIVILFSTTRYLMKTHHVI